MGRPLAPFTILPGHDCPVGHLSQINRATADVRCKYGSDSRLKSRTRAWHVVNDVHRREVAKVRMSGQCEELDRRAMEGMSAMADERGRVCVKE